MRCADQFGSHGGAALGGSPVWVAENADPIQVRPELVSQAQSGRCGSAAIGEVATSCQKIRVVITVLLLLTPSFRQFLRRENVVLLVGNNRLPPARWRQNFGLDNGAFALILLVAPPVFSTVTVVMLNLVPDSRHLENGLSGHRRATEHPLRMCTPTMARRRRRHPNGPSHYLYVRYQYNIQLELMITASRLVESL